MKAEWKPRAAFAEFAETLGISTDCIMMAKSNDDGVWTILWTADDGVEPVSDTPVFGVTMVRTADGVLGLTRLPAKVATLGSFIPPLPPPDEAQTL